MSVYHLYFDGFTEARRSPVMNSDRSPAVPKCIGVDGYGYQKWGFNEDAFREQSNDFKSLKETLEKTKHVFILIITKDQWKKWEATKKKYEYGKFQIFEMPNFVTNRNYVNLGRRLRLVILKGQGE